MKIRDQWSSRIGIIMAVAGSAIGLGNFLRFPAKAVTNGGGAFIIPYFVALLLLGIPLMLVEWTMGRMGGAAGSGAPPSILQSLAPKRSILKYLGIIGILGPLLIFVYYTYIESWTLAYSFYSVTGALAKIPDQTAMKSFLSGYQGLEHNQYFSGLGSAYAFFIMTFLANYIILQGGIKEGIEKFCTWALPILFVFAFALLYRVLTLNSADLAQPHWSVSEGFGFLWNPQFSSLKSAKVWLEAAGQIFFTLSVGTGVILTYASYLSRKDDITLSSVSSVSANEFAEVILGGSIIIPAAFIFFGPTEMVSIAASGIFNLGFVTMPAVINQLPLPAIMGFLWFFLLFLAALTSSVSLAQPFITFLEDEFGISRKAAVNIFSALTFILCQGPILFLRNGVVDELDFWGGSFCLIVFATIEIIMFGWVFGIDKGWEEMHIGSDIKIPRIYKFIIKYVTPLFLLSILGVWFWQEWLPIIFMTKIEEANRLFIMATRWSILFVVFFMVVMVMIDWKQKSSKGA